MTPLPDDRRRGAVAGGLSDALCVSPRCHQDVVTDMAYPGGCLCGAIRYVIERRHLNAMHCHCQMCRRAHGTAFSTHVLARPDQVLWELRGELVAYESSPDAYRKFCGRCGTHILVHGQGGQDVHAIPAGTLDGDPPLTLLGHMFDAERVGWCALSDTLPRHAGWPDRDGAGGS